MLSDIQVSYLVENGFKVSELKTKTVYWIYSDNHSIAVKNDCYDILRQDWGSMSLLATITTELDLEQFIILCAAFGIVCPELAVTKN